LSLNLFSVILNQIVAKIFLILFIVYTDHITLKTLIKYNNFISKKVRWIKILAIYFFKIEYMLRKKIDHADYLLKIN